VSDQDWSARTLTLTLGGDDGTAISVVASGSTQFSVDSDGNMTVAGTATITGAQTFTGMLTADGGVTLGNGDNIVLGTGAGTKIGTATTQKLGFYNKAPVVQPAFVADPTGGLTEDAEARTAIAAVIDVLIDLGLMAAS
jgi:hypothetical protein